MVSWEELVRNAYSTANARNTKKVNMDWLEENYPIGSVVRYSPNGEESPYGEMLGNGEVVEYGHWNSQRPLIVIFRTVPITRRSYSPKNIRRVV